jgi:hypothetical protein
MANTTKPRLLVILSESILAKSIALKEATKKADYARMESISGALEHDQESYIELAVKLGYWTD